MKDLVYELRMEATHGGGPAAVLLYEAADEIESLRNQLRDLTDPPQPKRSLRHDLPA